jgi:hypothetical protein
MRENSFILLGNSFILLFLWSYPCQSVRQSFILFYYLGNSFILLGNYFILLLFGFYAFLCDTIGLKTILQ